MINPVKFFKKSPIDKSKDIRKKVKKIISDNNPYLIEVVTNSNQTLLGTEP